MHLTFRAPNELTMLPNSTGLLRTTRASLLTEIHTGTANSPGASCAGAATISKTTETGKSQHQRKILLVLLRLFNHSYILYGFLEESWENPQIKKATTAVNRQENQ